MKPSWICVLLTLAACSAKIDTPDVVTGSGSAPVGPGQGAGTPQEPRAVNNPRDARFVRCTDDVYEIGLDLAGGSLAQDINVSRALMAFRERARGPRAPFTIYNINFTSTTEMGTTRWYDMGSEQRHASFGALTLQVEVPASMALKGNFSNQSRSFSRPVTCTALSGNPYAADPTIWAMSQNR